jgi:hypothetical protein
MTRSLLLALWSRSDDDNTTMIFPRLHSLQLRQYVSLNRSLDFYLERLDTLIRARSKGGCPIRELRVELWCYEGDDMYELASRFDSWISTFREHAVDKVELEFSRCALSLSTSTQCSYNKDVQGSWAAVNVFALHYIGLDSLLLYMLLVVCVWTVNCSCCSSISRKDKLDKVVIYIRCLHPKNCFKDQIRASRFVDFRLGRMHREARSKVRLGGKDRTETIELSFRVVSARLFAFSRCLRSVDEVVLVRKRPN